jgi:hypothetical protein
MTYWATYISPWYWRIPFAICDWIVMWWPTVGVRRWANRHSMAITAHFGPFAHGRGWYCGEHQKYGPH